LDLNERPERLVLLIIGGFVHRWAGVVGDCGSFNDHVIPSIFNLAERARGGRFP